MDYVAQFLRLDERSESLEAKLQEYTDRVEQTRWEQSRIAWEAVNHGGFTRTKFAQAVGHGHNHIGVLVRMWEAGRGAETYREAYTTAQGTTPKEQQRTSDIAVAKRVLRDPEAAKVVMKDAPARLGAREAIVRVDREKPKVKQSPAKGDEAFLDAVGDILDVEKSLIHLIENLNEARKNGHLTPSVLREFTGKLRLYADAIDEIADSRGLTDDALAAWIGGGE